MLEPNFDYILFNFHKLVIKCSYRMIKNSTDEVFCKLIVAIFLCRVSTRMLHIQIPLHSIIQIFINVVKILPLNSYKLAYTAQTVSNICVSLVKCTDRNHCLTLRRKEKLFFFLDNIFPSLKEIFPFLYSAQGNIASFSGKFYLRWIIPHG